MSEKAISMSPHSILFLALVSSLQRKFICKKSSFSWKKYVRHKLLVLPLLICLHQQDLILALSGCQSLPQLSSCCFNRFVKLRLVLPSCLSKCRFASATSLTHLYVSTVKRGSFEQQNIKAKRLIGVLGMLLKNITNLSDGAYQFSRVYSFTDGVLSSGSDKCNLSVARGTRQNDSRLTCKHT